MTRTLFLCAVALGITHTAAWCDILVVPDDFPTINEALWAIGNYDTVLVRPGVYRENLYPGYRPFRLLSEQGPEATVVIGGLASGTSWAAFDIVIRGFTFREAWGIGTGSGYGDTITIANCIVEDNDADCGSLFPGGGITVNTFAYPLPEHTIVIDSCVVRRNRGCRGGGIFLRRGVVSNSTIVDNSATDGGGGLYLSAGRFQVINCTVANNRVDTVKGPTAGAGIEISGARLTIDRTAIAGNVGGAGVHVDFIGAPPTISCTDAWGNEGGNYSGVEDPTGSNGNISLDPEFCDPGTGDYTVRASSPCAPDNSPPGCGLIGALPVGCGVQAIVDQGTSITNPLLLVRPNPASGSVEFHIGQPVENAVIEIYSLRGTLVQVLSGGPARIAWLPPAEVPSGVYLARTLAGEHAVVAKFILVR